MELNEWLNSEEVLPWMRAPYNRACPSCGDTMVYPTRCNCDFEKRVFALAGLDWTAAFTRENLIRVNRAMRALDDSGSYPVNSRFNATERAIRRVRDHDVYGLDGYVRAVDHEIGRIVNSL